MIGLPGETDEDVMGIVDTIQMVQRECRWAGAWGGRAAAAAGDTV
jgi:hypothetical protein